MTRNIISFLIIFIFVLINWECNKKYEIHEKYLEIYYEYATDPGQSLEARQKYLNIVLEVCKKHKQNNKKQACQYLSRIRHKLETEQSQDADVLLLVLNEAIIQKNINLSAFSSKNELKPSKKLWFNNETERRKKNIKKLINTPDWDSEIYGTWIHQTESLIEQYRFYNDTSFEYIKIISSGNVEELEINEHIKELGRISLVRRGQYKSSKVENLLTLYYDDLKEEKELVYILDSQRLNLDGKDFFKKKLK